MDPETQFGEIDDVSQSVHSYLYQKHRTFYVSMWVLMFAVYIALFCFLYFVLGDKSAASFSENDGSIIFFIFPLFIPLGVMGYYRNKIQQAFMEEIAQLVSYSFSKSAPADSVSGAFFSTGFGHKLWDVLSGQYKDFPVRIFFFSFEIQEGKRTVVYQFSVFEITYKAPLPHVLLLHGGESFTVGGTAMVSAPSDTEKVTLEGNFNAAIRLYVEKGGQTEIREIFQPDVMQSFLQEDKALNLEIKDTRLYLIQESTLTNRKEVLDFIKSSTQLFDTVEPSLRAITEKQ